MRNGLRKITLRNERDNRSFPMAQVLVNIKVFTTDEIEQDDSKLNHAIEVMRLLLKTKCSICLGGHLRGKGWWVGLRLATNDKKGQDACFQHGEMTTHFDIHTSATDHEFPFPFCRR